MADAITEVISDPERAAAMGRAARERVAQLFQWDQAAAGIAEILEETVRAAHRRPRAA
jgi:glycosyltransferase involved in cell wall biosynthesis